MAVCMKCTFCLVGLYQHQWCLLTDLLFLFKSRLMHCHFSQGVFFYDCASAMAHISFRGGENVV